ncbi:MAG: acetyl-CoA carboxylase biotin carboxyl carrier protein [Chlamydiia bacterium]|nr:acetyl-CoA carboxylase biotin carboxyl carrier protein [Chlamydiia bacterium]MCP5509053.1 acetyl-CoA carboxylase biotin carboxyl carrier protein [Chlamydiales bacterium]HPE85547.1 acetyl-CoA carboxylase biotin carboxyl carrier protein [Chlamydiales bacterium]
MDLDEIKDLMAAMGDADMNEVSIKEKGFEIVLKRGFTHSVPAAPMPVQHTHAPLPQTEQPKPSVSSDLFITSPMVGTFYGAPSPDDPPFVKVGDQVDPDTVVCIVEAMKVMNEVKAGVSGRVAEILIKSADPVEFGTKLIRVE